MSKKSSPSIKSLHQLNRSFDQSVILQNDPNLSIIRKLETSSISEIKTRKSIFDSRIRLNIQVQDQKIYTLASLIKNHHNPFMILQLKDYFLKWDPQAISSITTLPKYFDIDLIEQKVLQFQEIYEQKDTENEKKVMIKSFRKELQALKYSKYFDWQAAKIFLNSSQIKKIPRNVSQKLMKLIDKAQEERLLEFIQTEIFQCKGFDKERFIAEISKQKLSIGRLEAKKQITIKNVDTLISQMIKTMPLEDDSVEKLMKNLDNCKVLQSQMIELRSVKASRFINGKIVSAQCQNQKGKQRMVKMKIQTGEGTKLLQISINEYPNKIKVYGYRKIPLSEQIDFGNIMKWHKTSGKDFYSYQRPNQLFAIEVNTNFFGQASLLSKGSYKISCVFSRYSTNSYQLIFEQTQKQQTFRLTVINKSKDNQTKAIQYNHKVYSYQQFTNSYLVNRVQSINFLYSSKKEIKDSLRIYESYVFDGKYFYQKLKKIEEQKRNVLNLLQTEVKDFQQSEFFKRFIQTKEINEDYLKKHGVMRYIKLIVEQKNFVKEIVSPEEIISEILYDFNYATLINKQNTLQSLKTIGMFIKSQDFCSSMLDKQIIVVYGNTGSGKSTTVNYLTGVPLQEGINQCGDKIILINQDFRKKQLKKNAKDTFIPAKIGYSNIISETLYSHGYRIIDQEDLRSEIGLKQGIVFCDNPGFEDTRGTSYEICTNLSMDRAIQLCRSVAKIILIISEQIIKSERGIHLMRLMENMYGRFPSLQDPKSLAFENFSILITKARLKGRLDINLERYLDKSIQEFRMKIQELRQEKNHLQIESVLSRIKVYQCLKQMMLSRKIHFVNIKDDLDRRQILLQYCEKSKPINKESYKKCMQSSNLKLFANQLSICAHTWSKLILKRYLEEIPAELSKITTSLRSNRMSVGSMQSNSKKLNQEQLRLIDQLKKKRQKQQKHKREMQIAINNQRLDMEQKKFKPEFQEKDQAYVAQIRVINQLEQDIGSSKIYELGRYNRQREELEIKLQQLTIKSIVNIKNIQEWKLGHIDQQIISERYEFGEEFRYSEEIYSAEDREFYLKRGQTLPSNRFQKVFKCGQDTKHFGKIFKISRNYKLLPSKQFDPNNYLKTSHSLMGKYEANIESQGHVLQNVKLFDDGKTLFLSVKIHFKKCNSKKELPYLKISHKIPNEQHFSDAIKNAQAQNNLLIKQIGTLQLQLINLEAKQDQLNRELQTKQSKSKLMQLLPQGKKEKQASFKKQVKISSSGSIDLETYKYSKQKIIQGLGQEIKIIETAINNAAVQIKLSQQNIQRQNDEFSKLKKDQERIRWLKKRFALLIKHQFEKRIPQTLIKFIQITRISEQTNAEYKAEVFNEFKTKFKHAQKDLLGKCQRDIMD